MFIELLAALLVGVALGIFTGIVPGVHINLVAAIILSLSPLLLAHFSPVSLAVAIMAMSITHVFIDFIPSIFLGAPSDATALAVLPGHQLLLQGRGYEAVMLSSIGGVFGILAVVLLLPLLLLSVKWVFAEISGSIGILLLCLVVYNVMRERGTEKRFWALSVFLMAGFLGLLTLNVPNLKQPLLPLLAGLFGISTLLASAMNYSCVPIQVKTINELKKTILLKSVAAGAFSGGFMGIFPALGPAQAAMLARNIIGKAEKREYLVTLGAVSASSMLFGLVTLFAINKARNGSIAILSEIVPVNLSMFLLLIAAAITVAGTAFILASAIGKLFAGNIYRISYARTSFFIMSFIAAITFYFSQFTGLLILVTGTAIGMLTISKGVARHNLMGCLMLPVISYYFAPITI